MAIKKAKVGDYVKVIKKLPYKDKMDVELGDIGIVNYVASTGKYSVHIDGKKNPHDTSDQTQYGRLYGEFGDFWIPFDCCEVVDLKFKIDDKVRINYPQATKIHNCTGTIIGVKYCFNNLTSYLVEIVNTDNKTIKTISSENRLEKIVDISEELTRQCLFENADALDIPFVPLKSGHVLTPEKLERYDKAIKEYINKESEEIKMKEIKNQKVVDLYFERRKEALNDEFDTINKSIVDADKHHIFMQDLKYQFETYLEDNEIKDKTAFSMNESKEIVFFPVLPLTDESKDKQTEAYNDYKKKLDELNNIKEEITALLSGCDTYEQEMEILQTYKIVNYNTHYVSMNKIDASETN